MKVSRLASLACLHTRSFTLPINSTQNLEFGDCPLALASPSSRLRCGNLVVPMDWDNPSNGESITLGVVKISARDPARRIGPLFYNPGGPGIATSNDLARTALGSSSRAHAEILDRFDLIGVDLRGSGLSSPISCDVDVYNAQFDSEQYQTTPESYDALVKHNQAFRQSCINMTGNNLIDYMDTISIARDHEAVRQALGGERLTWLGQSYGTFLGSHYAELYAENIRGMLLDGPVSLSQSETALLVESGQSAEADLDYFFDWCARANASTCPLAHQNTTTTVVEIWDDLIAKADRTPIPAPACASGAVDCPRNAATPALLRSAVLVYLYAEENFRLLGTALYQAAFKDDASFLLQNAPKRITKSMSAYNTSTSYANVAISCQDWAHRSSATDMFWYEQIAKHDMPHLMGLSPEPQFIQQCVGWPQPRRDPPGRICIPETLEPKLMMVTNMYDPATPSAMAVQLQQEIGSDRTVLVGRKAAGHTVYFIESAFEGPTVAAMNHYLLTLEVPEQMTMYPN